MPFQSLSDARGAVDPLLTSIAFGVKIRGHCGHLVLPNVYVPKRKVRILDFGKRRGRKLLTTRRAPGSAIHEVSIHYGTKEIELYQDALMGLLPAELGEEAEPFVDQAKITLAETIDYLATRIEFDRWQLISSFGSYPATNRLAATTGVNNFGFAGADPMILVDNAKQAVLNASGCLPNTAIFGGLSTFNAFRNNPNIRDRVKYTSSRELDLGIIGAMMGVSTIAISVGNYLDANDVQQPFFNNGLWLGYVAGNGEGSLETNMQVKIGNNAAVLAAGMQEIGQPDKTEPSFGYTYVHEAANLGDGTASPVIVKEPYWDGDINSHKMPVLVDRIPAIGYIDSGYIIVNAA